MAEIAAGAIVAEQVVSTGLEAGAVAAVARPTQPLKGNLTQIAVSSSQETALALARSHHSVTVINNRAFIFGGRTHSSAPCSNEVHAVSLPTAKIDQNHEVDYACYPSLAMKDTSTGELLAPSPRSGHAACSRGKSLVVHGGLGSESCPINEDACLWTWDSDTIRWTKMSAAKGLPTPPGTSDHSIFYDEQHDFLVMHGGKTGQGVSSSQTWTFDFKTTTWRELPPAPAPTMSAAYVDGILYTMSGETDVSGSIQYLDIGTYQSGHALVWETIGFPSNALAPGPRPRVGGALIPAATGMGRKYLLYLLGSREDVASGSLSPQDTAEHPFYSDMWSLQLPVKGFSGAKVKDEVRDKLPGVHSGAFSWAEIEILPGEQAQSSGKIHPGPRAFFGAGGCLGGSSLVFTGGIDAGRQVESDAWFLEIHG